jgi:hypothetical protein
MILALFIVGLLLISALLMLSNSQFSASDTLNTEQKNQAFDGAEAGLDAAMESLDLSTGTSSSGSGTVANGESYSYTISNNLLSSGSMSVSHSRTIPGYSALISSQGFGALGGRPVTVESVVMPSTNQIVFPNDAIDAGLDIQGNWNSGNCIGFAGSVAGTNNANIHANHNITANACFTDGSASASGTITGTINATGGTSSGVAQVSLPTAQMATFVSTEKTVAQSSPPLYPNDYIAAGGSLPTTYNCPVSALPVGCVVFVDSAVSMSSHDDSTYTGKVTVVVNGDFSATGNAQLTFQAGQKSVFIVNGNADVGGNGSAAALIWAKGDVTLHGNGNLAGAAVAGGNVTLNGGGSGGGFTYDATLQNITLGTQGKLVIITYGEY